MKSRYPVGYNLQSPSLMREDYSQQIANQFPVVGSGYGYCGNIFQADPPEDANCRVIKPVDVDNGEEGTSIAYECRGTPITEDM